MYQRFSFFYFILSVFPCLLPFFSSNISLISFSDITLCPLFPFLFYFFTSSHHIYFLLFPSFLNLLIFFLLLSFFPELSSFSTKLFFSQLPLLFISLIIFISISLPSFLLLRSSIFFFLSLLKFFPIFSNFCHTYNLSSYNLHFLSLCLISYPSSFLVYFNVLALSCHSFLNLFQYLNSFLFFSPLYIILAFIFIP